MFSRKISPPQHKPLRLGETSSICFSYKLFWLLVLGTLHTLTACDNLFSYKQYDAILRSYVNSEGLVEYSMLQIDRAPLDSFLLCAEKLKPSIYSNWSRQEQIAFFINVYNAKVLEIIIDHYPITPLRLNTFLYPLNSIMQIGDIFRSERFTAIGRTVTLHYIEKQIFGKELNEPAVHFALVRGTMSCPPLLNTPYTGELLYNQLQNQAVEFLNKAGNFNIDTRTETVYLSAILKRINPPLPISETDKKVSHLPRSQRNRIVYLSEFLTVHDRDFLLYRNYQVRFTRMNWKLNVWK